MLPYEGLYSVKNIGGTKRVIADNAYSALLPALMRAQFPEYVAFSPATVLASKPGERNLGEYSPARRTIELDPEGINAMFMSPSQGGGYIGDTENNLTTEETLNALRTMLHESTHARMRGPAGAKWTREHPAKQLKQQMDSDRYDEMLRDIRASGFPSTEGQENPVEVINEYFATATPARQMAAKNMATRKNQGFLYDIDRLAKKYPELEKMRRDWERPELFMNTR
jgi:hypothetical protein